MKKVSLCCYPLLRMKTRTNLREINFINFPKQSESGIRKAVEITLESEKKRKYRINFVMISNREIKKLNTKYRKEKHITDVLSFLIEKEFFTGDVYIAENRSRKQAEKYSNAWPEELAYLAIHGTLHLCGYADYDVESKVKMFNKQDKIFKSLFSLC